MLKQAGLLPNLPANSRLLDNAAGGGCVVATLFQALEKDGIGIDDLGGLKVICGDFEPKMVENASQRINSKGTNTKKGEHLTRILGEACNGKGEIE